MTTRSRSERAKLAYTLKSPQRKEFFRVWDARPQGQSMREFCAIHKQEQWCPSHSHGYRWLKERDKIIKEGLGSPTRRLPPQSLRSVLKKILAIPLRQWPRDHVPKPGRANNTRPATTHSTIHWRCQCRAARSVLGTLCPLSDNRDRH